MNTNLKIILSAVGVAALLASPAMAKSRTHSQHIAHVLSSVPADANASANGSNVLIVSPYAASTPVQNRNLQESNFNPDFQLGGEY